MATVLSDRFGSVERRRVQAERDAQESGGAVRSIYSGAAPMSTLALRPLAERVELASPRPKTAAEREARWLRKQCRKRRMSKAQMRRAIESVGLASSLASR